MRTRKKRIVAAMAGFAVVVWLMNTSVLARRPQSHFFLLAHRGLAQTYGFEGLTMRTCTATRILPPEHPYLENTIASMRVAFEMGADIVEFDVQGTKDGKLAVFHDGPLECGTNGHGSAANYTMAELKLLDVGYGFTADGGKTYPFRGKGVGSMPAIDEVFQAFPGRAFFIHLKTNQCRDGILLAEKLMSLPVEERKRMMVYGGDRPVAEVRTRVRDVPTMSHETIKACATSYLAFGWTGYVPASCASTVIMVPVNWGRVLWGWPDRFLNRMDAVGTKVLVTGPNPSLGPSRGVDLPEDYTKVPTNYSGGVWTNRIDRIGSLLGRNSISTTTLNSGDGAPACDHTAMQRVLRLEGGRNFRDLGGYCTDSGRRVKWGMVFRSGSLNRLTPRDYRALEGLRLREVYDLRTPEERENEPTRWTGTIPALKSYSIRQASTLSMVRLLLPLAFGQPTVVDAKIRVSAMYGDMVTRNCDTLANVYHDLLSSSGPVLVHCSAGRDRTGIVSAFLLRMLGVGYSQIREDYLLSNQDASAPSASENPQRQRYLALATRLSGRALDPAILRVTKQADSLYLDSAFARVDKKFGSFDGFRRTHLRLSDEDLNRLVSKLTE